VQGSGKVRIIRGAQKVEIGGEIEVGRQGVEVRYQLTWGERVPLKLCTNETLILLDPSPSLLLLYPGCHSLSYPSPTALHLLSAASHLSTSLTLYYDPSYYLLQTLYP